MTDATRDADRSRPRRPPPDDALVHARDLLDPELLRVRATEDLRANGSLTDAGPTKVRYLEYTPGADLLVHAATPVSDEIRDFVARTDALTNTVEIHWFPDDPMLPVLAADRRDLVGTAGLDPAAEWVRLAWVPRQRVVFAVGDWIVKGYSNSTDAITAFDRSRLAAEVVDTAAARTVLRDVNAVVFPRIHGTTLTRHDALASCAEAAVVLRHLHDAPTETLPHLGALELLRQCSPVVTLASFLRPDLAERIRAVEALLHATRPSSVHTVAAHGDFNVGQLVRTAQEKRLVVVDTDTLARADACVDLAGYAANLMSGRAEDAAAVDAVLERLTAEYAHATGALQWYLAATLLRRLDRAFRRAKRHWSERLAVTLETVERWSHDLAPVV